MSPPSPVVFASDPFAAISQVVKGGSSLLVTPSFIPISATQVLDVELSPNEGPKEALEDSDDEPIMKTRVSNNEPDTKAMDKHFRSLLSLLSLLFLLLEARREHLLSSVTAPNCFQGETLTTGL